MVVASGTERREMAGLNNIGLGVGLPHYSIRVSPGLWLCLVIFIMSSGGYSYADRQRGHQVNWALITTTGQSTAARLTSDHHSFTQLLSPTICEGRPRTYIKNPRQAAQSFKYFKLGDGSLNASFK